MRNSVIERNTNETKIKLALSLDGSGKTEISSGSGFMDHMLELFAKHGRMDLSVNCDGDTHVDYHHSVEDIGIVLGQAFKECVGDKRGITRYGNMMLPMDETLAVVSIDISGRSHLTFNVNFPSEKVGEIDTELFEEFFTAFVRSAEVTLHVNVPYGTNTHHIIEGVFKSFGRAVKQAVSLDPSLNGEIPSSKGML